MTSNKNKKNFQSPYNGTRVAFLKTTRKLYTQFTREVTMEIKTNVKAGAVLGGSGKPSGSEQTTEVTNNPLYTPTGQTGDNPLYKG